MEQDILVVDKHIKLEYRDGKYYLCDSITNKILPVNQSAGFIFERLQKGLPRENIIGDLLDNYQGVDADTLNKDIDAFLNTLRQQGFIASGEYPREPKVKLDSVCFGITNKCNLSCKHCLAGKTLGDKNEFSLARIKDILNQMSEMGVGSISFFGGEPMLRRDFFDILEEASKTRLGLAINTNGTLIDDKAIRRFKDSRLRTFCVSLDGASEEVHDAFRGKGSFIRTLRGIERLIAAGFSVMLSAIVTRYNQYDLENIVELGKRIGVRQVRFNSIHYGGNALCFSQEIMLAVKEKFQALKVIKALRDRFGEFVTGSECQVVDILKELAGKEPLKLPLIVRPCGAAMNKCNIRPDGYVTPCELLWDVKCANVKEKALKEIWEDDPVLNEFRRPILLSRDKIPGCEGCEYLRLCYQGHRCSPYYIGEDFYKDRELYCWREIEK